MDHRTIERQDAQFGARCASLGRSSDSRLLNVSPQGCLIELVEPILENGSPVRIKIAGVSCLDGKVIWRDGLKAGVSFATPLHPAVVEYIAGCLDIETTERLGLGSIASTG